MYIHVLYIHVYPTIPGCHDRSVYVTKIKGQPHCLQIYTYNRISSEHGPPSVGRWFAKRRNQLVDWLQCQQSSPARAPMPLKEPPWLCCWGPSIRTPACSWIVPGPWCLSLGPWGWSWLACHGDQTQHQLDPGRRANWADWWCSWGRLNQMPWEAGLAMRMHERSHTVLLYYRIKPPTCPSTKLDIYMQNHTTPTSSRHICRTPDAWCISGRWTANFQKGHRASSRQAQELVSCSPATCPSWLSKLQPQDQILWPTLCCHSARLNWDLRRWSAQILVLFLLTCVHASSQFHGGSSRPCVWLEAPGLQWRGGWTAPRSELNMPAECWQRPLLKLLCLSRYSSSAPSLGPAALGQCQQRLATLVWQLNWQTSWWCQKAAHRTERNAAPIAATSTRANSQLRGASCRQTSTVLTPSPPTSNCPNPLDNETNGLTAAGPSSTRAQTCEQSWWPQIGRQKYGTQCRNV